METKVETEAKGKKHLPRKTEWGKVMTPLEALERLKNDQFSCAKEKYALILEIETMSFSSEQEKDLAELLWTFVSSRLRNRQEDLVVVCSAIRKMIGSMDVYDMDRLITFIPNNELPLPTTLEIVKMVARKFIANPPPLPDMYVLGDAIWEVFKSSVQKPQENYSAITLNALLSLSAMKSKYFRPALELFYSFYNHM
jgi:hypothetical protein